MVNKVSKKHLIVLAAVAILCLLCGFLVGKGMYDRPLNEKVERDTVMLHDTVPDYKPVPKDSIHAKTVIKWLPKWLPAKPDTITNVEYYALHDTVAVEVPITSKHYGTSEYDAYISGYEPNLDSIFVYQKTQLITERVTISKPPNKWELNAVAGIKYNTTNKEYTPSAGIELLYKPNRMSLGIQGGIEKNDKVEPVINGVMKIRIM